jgi:PGAP1-like protein
VASSPSSPPDHVTPYDRAAWSDTQVEQWLANGEHRDELIAYFGSAEYRALATLAHRAQRRRLPGRAMRVLVVPGIMGSLLGLRRRPPLPHDILWIDPIDIHLGRLAWLRVPDAAPAPIIPLGVVLFSYLRLKLYLRARGFAAEFHDYDWRLPVVESGRALAARLQTLRGTPLAIVAHSMGGLVSRAALALPGTSHVERVVLLGTPNSGSFAAVQALRGTYAVVRKVARLDTASAERLSADVFNTFPSLYDLLPHGACAGAVDLFDAGAWPSSGPRPGAALLHAARAAHQQLASADERFAVVAGVGTETVTAVARRREEFVYTLTRYGDGTVPVASAALAGAPSTYARVAHSELTRDPVVAAAVVDLLERGTTGRLPGRWSSVSRARTRVSDAQLRRSHTDKVDWGSLTPEARRQFLERLNEPPRFILRVPGERRRKHRTRGSEARGTHR